MGVPIKYHNGTEWVLIDAGAIVDSNGNRITADNITDHFSTDGTLLQKGHVQLSSATDSTSEVLAATPKAVKDVKDASIPLAQKGVVNGVASLDAGTKIPLAQIPTASMVATSNTLPTSAPALSFANNTTGQAGVITNGNNQWFTFVTRNMTKTKGMRSINVVVINPIYHTSSPYSGGAGAGNNKRLYINGVLKTEATTINQSYDITSIADGGTITLRIDYYSQTTDPYAYSAVTTTTNEVFSIV